LFNPCVMGLFISEQGVPIVRPDEDRYNVFQYLDPEFKSVKEQIFRFSLDELRPQIDPFLLGISFMHCNNVQILEAEVPRQLINKQIKKHGRVPVRYYVLNIEPFKEVLRAEGCSDEVGAKKALHICRGHFKNYEEHGLFGKHYGRYWWSDAVRGSKEQGIVIKDYDVGAPE
jgi:hypothetical protein